MMERLQKVIALSGIASRRKAEQLITKGCVTVNSVIVTELGTKVDISHDRIKVNSKSIHINIQFKYILMNKPKKVVSSLNDPLNRTTVIDILKGIKCRVYPVGRLDYNSEGLILLTNDGELAHRLMHPKYNIKKTYSVKVKGILEYNKIERLKQGVYLDNILTIPIEVSLIAVKEKNTWLSIIVAEGRNRLIRRMCDEIGHPVLKLVRTSYAFLSIKGINPGEFRPLTPFEIKKIKALCGL